MTETEAPERDVTTDRDLAPLVLSSRSPRVTVIRPAPRWPSLDLRELWLYRELLGRLAWRDIAVRYKQTSIGVAWAILQPFLTMVVFTIVFGKFADFPSKGIPYPIFSYSALLPWTYFASAVAVAGTSLVSNRGLVTKVYFPRVILPLAGVTVPIVDFVLAFVVLFGLMVWFQVVPSLAILLAPFFLLMALVTALGVGLFLSALNVRYRDVPYAIPFLIPMWMYFSGVVYALDALRGVAAVGARAQSDDSRDQRLPVGCGRNSRTRAREDSRERCGDDDVLPRRPLVLPAFRAAFRGQRSDERRRSSPKASRRGTGSASCRGVRDTARLARGRAAARRPTRAPPALRGDLGASRRLASRSGRRGARHHRAERRGQVDAAEDPRPDHDADDRVGRDPRPGRQPARGRHRVPSRAHRAREHLPQRRGPRDEAP